MVSFEAAPVSVLGRYRINPTILTPAIVLGLYPFRDVKPTLAAWPVRIPDDLLPPTTEEPDGLTLCD